MAAGTRHPRTRAARLRLIRERLVEDQEVSISELAKACRVSEMTVRRDLKALEEQGDLLRTRGGAMPAERMLFEFDFSARRACCRAEKRAIATAAARLVRPGMRVLLDNGTTTLELADILVEYDDLTVVTPSLAVASLLQFADGVQTILLGGFLRRGRPELTGLITESVLDMLAVDLAFQGADGIGIDGTLYTDDPRVAQVDRRIRERAEQTIVLADAGKIGRSGLIVHGHLRDVAGLITAPAPPPPVREALAAIVDLTVAEPVDP